MELHRSGNQTQYDEPDFGTASESLQTMVVSGQHDPNTVIHMSGEIDILTSSELRQCLREQLQATRPVVLDFRHVKFLGTTGLEVLSHWLDQADAVGIQVALVANSASVIRPLAIAGIEKRVVLSATKREAMTGLR
jgi:anti-sigma B factor antagonist